MTPKEKKEFAENLMNHGDKRSYNEIKADLELQFWKERFNPELKPLIEAE